MKNNLKNNLKNKKKKGFTLIELIIVIAIIAIIAAIALPKFGQVRENANIKSDIANAKNIQSAVVALVGDGEISNGATFTVTSTDTEGSKVVNYLQNEPKGKASNAKGNAFQVEVDSTGNVTVLINEAGNPVQVYPQIGSGTYSEK